MVGNTRPRRKSPRSCVKVPPLRNCALTSPHGTRSTCHMEELNALISTILVNLQALNGRKRWEKIVKWPLKSKRPQVLWLGHVSLILVSRWAILTHTKSPWVKKTSSTRIFFRWNSAPALKCSLAVRHSRHCLHPTWQMVRCLAASCTENAVPVCVCEIISTYKYVEDSMSTHVDAFAKFERQVHDSGPFYRSHLHWWFTLKYVHWICIIKKIYIICCNFSAALSLLHAAHPPPLFWNGSAALCLSFLRHSQSFRYFQLAHQSQVHPRQGRTIVDP